ncbi:hypothetical protein VP1G_05048 [Cytospora mali]|uniref:ER membrane protein complex subunit 7 beta-sandwich domain-containing protein n=1 Tax=Cytospora mali TaxID=578113 RepID=A0A194V189_CYTMA|nr:hypothetical protein VP1G_05048 [Valsa mali var. pyri (nom. inval.)]
MREPDDPLFDVKLPAPDVPGERSLNYLQLQHGQAGTTSPTISTSLPEQTPRLRCYPTAKMRTQLLTTLFLSLLTLIAATTTTTTSITFQIPPTHILPNPRALPPQTHATLTSFHFDASALLTPAGTFVFRNVSEGSYLLDVHCPTVAFAPLRVDVLPVVSGAGQTEKEERTALLKVNAWETYRGNDWGNTGEAVAVGTGGSLDVKVLGAKNFYMERSKFNLLSIFKSPMILLGLVSMAAVFGMPYLMDNMDPEFKKEWEESQKSSPMNGLMGGQAGAQNPMGNFDMAAFLAGSSSKNNGGDSAGAKGQKGAKR